MLTPTQLQGTFMCEPLIIEPKRNATQAIIWMHGLGADRTDFESIIPELSLGEHHKIRFVFPQAPSIPVTLNGGITMPAWYDIISIENVRRQFDFSGMKTSCDSIIQLMEQQYQQGIEWDNMILAGFSQGGVIAYACSVFCPKKIAGLVSLSSYSPFDTQQLLQTSNVFIGHGYEDTVVPYQLGKELNQQLQDSHTNVDFRSYHMDHGVCKQEIDDISHWLTNILQIT